MNVIKLDLLDGRGMIQVVVSNYDEEDRLRRFTTEAGDAFNDRDRWLKVRHLMTHESSGPHTGWTLGMVLPGDDPDDAIDAVMP